MSSASSPLPPGGRPRSCGDLVDPPLQLLVSEDARLHAVHLERVEPAAVVAEAQVRERLEVVDALAELVDVVEARADRREDARDDRRLPGRVEDGLVLLDRHGAEAAAAAEVLGSDGHVTSTCSATQLSRPRR